jgi:hypothetical protein
MNKNQDIFSAFFISGGWVALLFTMVVLIDDVGKFNILQSQAMLYVFMALIGVCSIIHYMLFDVLPTLPYEIAGGCCWLASLSIFALWAYALLM